MIPGIAVPGTFAIGQTSDDVNAVASGVTLSISTSVIAGSASGSATAAGVTLQNVVTLTPGVPSISVQAEGATISAGITLVAGVASGSATAVGFTLDNIVTLTPGQPSVSTNIDGADLVAETGITAGVASGGQQPSRVSGGLPFMGPRRGDGLAQGTTLQAGILFDPGQADIGHEIKLTNAAGVERTITVFGMSDEELRGGPALMTLLMELDDDDAPPLVTISVRREAA